jgi:branched-chain amino acid transport system permease protein
MRSGFYKERYGQLVGLSDSAAVWAWVGVLVAVLVAAPFRAGPYPLGMLTVILFTLVGVLGLTILTGFTGLISLGHVAFLMIGAYAYAIGVSRLHLPPVLALLLATGVPAVFGLIVGLPSLRLHGLYLAITTLAFTFIINQLILSGGKFTGGAAAWRCSGPRWPGHQPGGRTAVLLLLPAVGGAGGAGHAEPAPHAGGARAGGHPRQRHRRTHHGHQPVAHKLLAFVLCACFTGFAGALMAMHIGFVNTEGFPFLLSIEALAIIIVGGIGSVLGAVLGTVFIVLLPEAFSLAVGALGTGVSDFLNTSANEIKSMLYGVAIIGFLMFDPRGLRGIWHDLRHAWVHWPLRF